MSKFEKLIQKVLSAVQTEISDLTTYVTCLKHWALITGLKAVIIFILMME